MSNAPLFAPGAPHLPELKFFSKKIEMRRKKMYNKRSK